MADYTEYLNDGLNLQDATTGPGYFLTVNDGITLSATSVETRLNETIADTIAISTTSSETANNTQLNTDSLAINDAGVSENLISTAIATFDGLSLSTTSPNIQSYAAWLAVNDGFGLSSFANNQIYNPYTQTDYFAVSGTGSKQGFTESSPAAFTVTDVISYTQHPLEIQVASLSGTYYGCVPLQITLSGAGTDTVQAQFLSCGVWRSCTLTQNSGLIAGSYQINWYFDSDIEDSRTVALQVKLASQASWTYLGTVYCSFNFAKSPLMSFGIAGTSPIVEPVSASLATLNADGYPISSVTVQASQYFTNGSTLSINDFTGSSLSGFTLTGGKPVMNSSSTTGTISAIIDAGSVVNWKSLVANTQMPSYYRMQLSARVADNLQALSSFRYRVVDSNTPQRSVGRYLQWQVSVTAQTPKIIPLTLTTSMLTQSGFTSWSASNLLSNGLYGTSTAFLTDTAGIGSYLQITLTAASRVNQVVLTCGAPGNGIWAVQHSDDGTTWVRDTYFTITANSTNTITWGTPADAPHLYWRLYKLEKASSTGGAYYYLSLSGYESNFYLPYAVLNSIQATTEESGYIESQTFTTPVNSFNYRTYADFSVLTQSNVAFDGTGIVANGSNGYIGGVLDAGRNVNWGSLFYDNGRSYNNECLDYWKSFLLGSWSLNEISGTRYDSLNSITLGSFNYNALPASVLDSAMGYVTNMSSNGLMLGQTVSRGLTSRWLLNNSIADVYANRSTTNSGVTFVYDSTFNRYVAYFNGSGYASFSTSGLSSGNTTLSLTAWVKTTSTSQNCDILGYGDNGGSGHRFCLSMWSNLQVENEGVGVGGYAMTSGVWYFAAATYNVATGTCKFYVNGALYATNTSFGLNLALTEGCLGRMPATGYNFNGYGSDFRLYGGVELTASEISNIYAGEIATLTLSSYNSMAFGCMFKLAATTGIPTFMYLGTASTPTALLRVDNTDSLGVQLSVKQADATAIVINQGVAFTDTSSWHSAVGICSNSKCRLYVDGVLIGSTAYNNTLLNTTGNLALGADYSQASTSSYFMNGYMTDFNFWQNGNWSDADALLLAQNFHNDGYGLQLPALSGFANQYLDAYKSNLIGFWKLDNYMPYDSSPNGSNLLGNLKIIDDGQLGSVAVDNSTLIFYSGLQVYEVSDGADKNSAADFNSISSANWVGPIIVANIDASSGSLITGMTSYYSQKFVGYIYAPVNGTYVFGTNSDDATDITVDGTLVCSYYGVHGASGYQTGSIVLTAGYHTFLYRYHQGYGGEEWHAAWQPPGSSSLSVIPATSFFHGNLTNCYLTATSTNGLILSGAFTMSCMLKLDFLPRYGESWVVAQADSYGFYLSNSTGIPQFIGFIKCSDGTTKTISMSNPVTGTWFNAALVYNLVTFNMLVNNVSQGTVATTLALASSSVFGVVGSGLAGRVSSIGLWNVALDATALSQLYYNGNVASYNTITTLIPPAMEFRASDTDPSSQTWVPYTGSLSLNGRYLGWQAYNFTASNKLKDLRIFAGTPKRLAREVIGSVVDAGSDVTWEGLAASDLASATYQFRTSTAAQGRSALSSASWNGIASLNGTVGQYAEWRRLNGYLSKPATILSYGSGCTTNISYEFANSSYMGKVAMRSLCQGQSFDILSNEMSYAGAIITDSIPNVSVWCSFQWNIASDVEVPRRSFQYLMQITPDSALSSCDTQTNYTFTGSSLANYTSKDSLVSVLSDRVFLNAGTSETGTGSVIYTFGTGAPTFWSQCNFVDTDFSQDLQETLLYSIRSSNDNATWTSWTRVPRNRQLAIIAGYVQVQVQFNRFNKNSWMPAVKSLSLTGQDATYMALVAEQVGSSTVSYSVTSPLNVTTHYYYRVMAYDGDKWSQWSRMQVLYTTGVNVPTAPTNLLVEGQANPTHLITFTPDFTWTFNDPSPAPTPTQADARILIGDASGLSDVWDSGKLATTAGIIYEQTGGQGASTPITLSRGVTYYWQVKAWDNSVNNYGSPYSSVATFKLNQLPTVPQPVGVQG